MGIPYAEVIGDPIAHSKSPLIHKFWLKKLGIDGDYRATRVMAEELPSYLAARRADPNWRGCNVTMPLKEAVLPLLDELRIGGEGAVNCILPGGDALIGLNTDIAGLAEALPECVDTAAPVCIIGAGGAARAAIACLDVLAVYQFRIIARNGAQAGPLLAPYGEYGRWFDFAHAEAALRDCVGVINASPLGMTGFPPMPESVLTALGGVRRGGFAVDLVYRPLETAFMAAARRAGLICGDGLTALIGQAAEAFAHFFNAPPPRDHDDELRELLTR